MQTLKAGLPLEKEKVVVDCEAAKTFWQTADRDKEMKAIQLLWNQQRCAHTEGWVVDSEGEGACRVQGG